MAAWDVTVNGVALNTLAYQVDMITNRRQLPLRADQNLTVAGRHGEVAVIGTLMPAQFSMRVWIDGTNTSGAIPGGSTFDGLLEDNLDTVLAAFDSGELLDIRIEMPNGSVRRCFAQVIAFAEGETGRARFHTYGLKIPGVQWESLTTVSQTFTTIGSFVDLTNLIAAGSKASPLTDFFVRAVGPITNPKFESDTLRWVNYTGTVAAGSAWVADSRLSRSRIGVGITDSSGGTSAMANTNYAGSGTYLLELTRPYKLRLTGTGTSGATAFEVVARPKFF